jgi:hypothetical protein
VRVVILTGLRRGSASRCLPALAEHSGIDVAQIVYCERQFVSRSRKLRRDLRKIRAIGVGGALIGYRMRSWYAGEPAEDIETLARRYDIRFDVSPRTNAKRTVELFRRCEARLGLSMGNGVIFPKVFRTPECGMLNVHGEVLPRFQGAASVIWAIHEGVPESGFTIHEVERGIDEGRILYQERFPMIFGETLEQTVRLNVARLGRRVPPALARVVGEFEIHRAGARVQQGGKSYTTPTLRQYLRMRRQFERMKAEDRNSH